MGKKKRGNYNQDEVPRPAKADEPAIPDEAG